MDKKGPAAYTLVEADKTEVVRESRSMIVATIQYDIYREVLRRQKGRGIVGMALTLQQVAVSGRQIAFDGKVRWQSTADESLAGSTYRSDEKVAVVNNALFYAYGGADLKLTGKIVKAAAVRQPGGHIDIVVDFRGEVTIADDYTFAPKGPLNARLWIDRYNAAHILETRDGYKPFKHSVTFDVNYTRGDALRISSAFPPKITE